MAITQKDVDAFVATLSAAKVDTKEATMKFAPAPASAEEIALVAAAFGTAGMPKLLERCLKLGGARVREIEATDAPALFKSRPFKSTLPGVAAHLMDAEIETPRPGNASDADWKAAIVNNAVNKSKIWTSAETAAKTRIADHLTAIKAELAAAGLEADLLAKARGGLGMLGEVF